MFGKFREIWDKYGFEIVIGLSILFILIMICLRWGKRGSWDDNLQIPGKQTKSPRNGPPTVSKGELKCRETLERLFSRPFDKIRPDSLRNPIDTDANLELDCYNDELKLAVEYNGIQHYKYTPYFHKTKETFHNQKYRDYIKRQLCRENGICLIEVPYTVKNDEIPEFLRRELIKRGKLQL